MIVPSKSNTNNQEIVEEDLKFLTTRTAENMKLSDTYEFFKSITVADWVLSEHFKSFPEQATVKIRSMAKNVPCSIRSTERGLLCTFDQPQRAPAPGQSAVFYQDDLVIGGGYIDEAFVENK